MGRPREFDEEEALEKVMELFWHKGYAETSMRDIAAFTGVSHAGIYNTFGDKRDIFKKALIRYDRNIGGMIIGPLEEKTSGRTEIEALFRMVESSVVAKQFKDGCLMCNTAVEFGDESGEFLNIARKNLRRMTTAFESALRRAVQRKEVRDNLDPKAVAAFLTATFHGVAIFARAQMPASYVKHTVETALRQLD